MKTNTLSKISNFTQNNIIDGFNLDPEFCHNTAMFISKNAEKSDWILEQVREACYVEGEEQLKTNISGLEFPNPIGLAAGFAKSPYGLKLWEAFGFGSITIGGITEHSQPGNNKQRIFRFPNGLVNGMGFPGKGLDDTISLLAERKVNNMYPQIPVGANLCNSAITKPEDTITEFKNQMLALYPYIDYFEINISCPNQAGVCGLSQKLEAILKELTEYNNTLAGAFGKKNKLFVKISPLSQNLDNPKDGTEEGLKTVADICNNYSNDGVHAVIATNTAKEHEYTDQTQIYTSSGSIITGGASGKQIQEVSRETVGKLRKFLDDNILIKGVGGIGYDEPGEEGKSTIDMLDSGADMVQIYSAFVQQSVLSVKYAKQAILES